MLYPNESRFILRKNSILCNNFYARLVRRFGNAGDKEIENYYHHLPTDRPVIIADAVGIHSKEVVEFLQGKGYSNVANLAGGIHDWERDGLPLIVDKDQTMTGGCMCQLRVWKKKKD
jgi:rhodanese-related sulfurtransferase